MVKRDLTLKITRLSEDSARYSGKAKVGGFANQRHPSGASKKGKKAMRRTAKKACKKRKRVSVFHVVPGDDFLIGSRKLKRKGRYSITDRAAPSGDKIMAFMAAFTTPWRLKDINGRKYAYEVICLKAVQFKRMP